MKFKCGSHLYAAPEIKELSEENPLTVTEKPDVYSLAKLICFLFDGFCSDHNTPHTYETKESKKIHDRFLKVAVKERPGLDKLKKLLQNSNRSKTQNSKERNCQLL